MLRDLGNVRPKAPPVAYAGKICKRKGSSAVASIQERTVYGIRVLTFLGFGKSLNASKGIQSQLYRSYIDACSCTGTGHRSSFSLISIMPVSLDHPGFVLLTLPIDLVNTLLQRSTFILKH